MVLALNDLAWIYATHPRRDLRNAVEAVRLAEQACQLSDRKLPTCLNTLAAAYAEAGRFAEAVTTAKKAIQIARASSPLRFRHILIGINKANRTGKASIRLRVSPDHSRDNEESL